MLDLIAGFMALTASFAYLNRRWLKLPPMIGIMAIALLLSSVLLLLREAGIDVLRRQEFALLYSIDFSSVVLEGMLSIMLFAAALHIDLRRLKAYRWQVGLLALLGTALSTAVIGFAMFHALRWIDMPLPLAYCLIFGALISPTDPVAVTGILKTSGAPASLELVISGESLCNDGVAIVLFGLMFSMLQSGDPPELHAALWLLVREGAGGVLLGVCIGAVAFRLLRTINSYQEEAMITLAAVLGGYALARHLGVSGPLAMVAAGLIVGNQGRALAMSDRTRASLDTFWELLDAILNAVLFALIGLEALVLKFAGHRFEIGAIAVIVTLLARLLVVGLPIRVLEQRKSAAALPEGAWQVLTWGGLRGGISIALALSLPAGHARDVTVTLTYSVVLFSVLVQGLTIGRVVRRAVNCKEARGG
jgi:CPA1 family monovalent cation:H+ antiporter